MSLSSIAIVSKDSLSTSLNRADALPISPITFCPGRAFLRFLIPSSQVFTKFRRSLSSSATSLPSATVLMITPKLAGFIELMSLERRLRSSPFDIFLDILTVLAKGTSTKYRPANDNSHDSRGPFVDIGSFTT